MVLDFPLEVGYTGKMGKETPLNDQNESATLCTIGHQRVAKEFSSVWASCGCPGAGRGCCRDLCGKQLGLPFAGHSPFQTNPVPPPQPLAEPLAAKVRVLQK